MSGEDREARCRLARIGRYRPNVEADLDAEFEFHFREVVDALLEGGCSLEAAEAEATRRLGNLTRCRRKLRRIGRRRRRKIVLREIGVTLASNIGWAFRSIRRRPALSAVVIVTLALGIGANTLMFGVVDCLFLSPPQHVRDADEVRHLYLERRENSGRVAWRRFTYPDYQILHQVDGFRQLAAYSDRETRPVGVREEVQQAYVAEATSSLFPLLGVEPLFGRFFWDEDDVAGAPHTVVLSEEFWTRRFGGDSSVVGRTISIGKSRGTAGYEVIGVAPAGFTGAELDRVDLWIPIVPELGRSERAWQNWVLNIVVRLQDGASAEIVDYQATAAHRSARAAWAENEGIDWYDPEARVFTSSIIAARGPNPSAVSTVSKWLAALSIIVLIVACANVTNLLLANNVRIRQELAIRASLGAGPIRVAGQLLTHTVVLAVLGGAAGLVLWFTLSPILHAAIIPNAGFSESALVPRVLIFAGIAILVTSIGAGILPSLQVLKFTDLTSLRTGSGGSVAEFSHLRHSLVAIQAALSVILLIGAGLFVMSLRRAREFDVGFSPAGVAEVKLEFRTGVGSLRRREIYREALNRLRALPGIRSAATYSGSRPLEGGMNWQLRIPGLDSVPAMPGGWPHHFRGSVDFLDVYGFRITKGRMPEPADAQPGAEPVMLVSALTERTLWPAGGALNRCAHVVGDETPTGEVEPCRRIVGVFDDVVVRSFDELPSFAFFIPIDDVGFWMPWGIAFRAESVNITLLERVHATVSDISSDVYFSDVHLVSKRMSQKLKRWTLGANLFSAFALLGLAMACVGLYSILAFDVAQRRRELGIRSALGAQSPRLVSAVLRSTVVYVVAGLALGATIALVAGRFLENLLFETTSSDPTVYAIVVGTLLFCGFAAGLVPSMRAASSDPLEIIRAE